MSFTLTIRNIPDKDLGPILARLQLPRGAEQEVKHTPDHVAALPNPAKGKPRANADTVLTMTGKTPMVKGGILSQALIEFEKCEKRNGIGSVTVAIYRDYLTKKQLDFKLQTRLLHEGYLEYLNV